jgi:23S rRNA (adenine2503-C2)-methyltransferase
VSEPTSLYNFTRRDLGTFLNSTFGAPSYTGGQVFRWLYQKKVKSVEEMTDLPQEFRKRLADETRLNPLHLSKKQTSSDGTIKYGWEVGPDPSVESSASRPMGIVESVLLPMHKEDESITYTACISTQAGCRMKCAFCATGVPSFRRNLTTAEIVAQIIGMEQDATVVFHNVVIMGMGEPLDNYDAALAATRIMNDPDGLNLGRRRVTLSTVGLLDALQRFTKDDWPVSLAISLHSADPAKRESLIPAARSNPLDKLRKALRDYTFVRRLPVTLEILLLGNINDSPEDADLLAAFTKGLLCKVNLIRYNPVPGLPFQSPTEEAVTAFQQRLWELHVRGLLRERKGADIDAACGQLGYDPVTSSDVIPGANQSNATQHEAEAH